MVSAEDRNATLVRHPALCKWAPPRPSTAKRAPMHIRHASPASPGRRSSVMGLADIEEDMAVSPKRAIGQRLVSELELTC